MAYMPENFSQFFGPLKQGYMQKVSFCRVVHGCDKVMLGSMELPKVPLGDKGDVYCHGLFCWGLCSMYFELPWVV